MNKKLNSVLPIYAAGVAWALSCIILPMYRWRNILFAVLASGLIFAIAYILSPKREVAPKIQFSPIGNADVDQMVRASTAHIQGLRDAQAAIANPRMRHGLDQIIASAKNMIEFVIKNPQSYRHMNEFSTHYLPTVRKLVDNYRELQQEPQSPNIVHIMAKIEDAMDTAVEAFNKQLDALYADMDLDISADIGVMKSLMAQDGLLDDGSNFTQRGRDA